MSRTTFRDTLKPYVVLAVQRPATTKAKRCPQVSLRGKSLVAARKALAQAGCSVGEVSRPKRAGKRKLVVRFAGRADARRRVNLILKVKQR